MDSRLILLKLILDKLHIPASINTIDDRKRVQKAVYLGQRTGVDLGYRFGWYLRGPYSSDLARDYYALDEAIRDGETDHVGRQLIAQAAAKIATIADLMSPPQGVALEQEDWLELVASLDYLIRVQRCSTVQAKKTLVREKPRLVNYFEQAYQALKSVGLQ